MNDFTVQAESYKKYLEKHPGASDEIKRSLEKNIKVNELLSVLDEEERLMIFDTGIFNQVCYGYLKLVLKESPLSEANTEKLLQYLFSLFDEMSAAEVLKKSE